MVSEIQGHVQILTNTLFSISDRLLSSDDDLRYLVNDVEDEHSQLLEKYKQTVDRVISDLLLEGASPNQSPTQLNYNLEQVNQQMQEELQQA